MPTRLDLTRQLLHDAYRMMAANATRVLLAEALLLPHGPAAH
jgi:hypothetical protein